MDFGKNSQCEVVSPDPPRPAASFNRAADRWSLWHGSRREPPRRPADAFCAFKHHVYLTCIWFFSALPSRYEFHPLSPRAADANDQVVYHHDDGGGGSVSLGTVGDAIGWDDLSVACLPYIPRELEGRTDVLQVMLGGA